MQLLTQKERPVVVSTLFAYETRLSVAHFKVMRGDEDAQTVIPSKTVLEAHVGFRRFLIRPVFSESLFQN